MGGVSRSVGLGPPDIDNMEGPAAVLGENRVRELQDLFGKVDYNRAGCIGQQQLRTILKYRDWHVFFITRLIDHQMSSGRWQINRT